MVMVDGISSPKNAPFRHPETVTKIHQNGDENSRPRGRPRKYRTNADRQRAYRKRLKRSVHFRSDTDLWSTPESLFQVLHEEFHFTCDVCADDSNAKCATYFTKEVDGLSQKWAGVCWCNPPYGAEIHMWVQKAFESSLFGTTVVCLLPARVDTRWWRDNVMAAAEIRYLPGRLKFVGGEDRAPFPSAVVIFYAREGNDEGR
jgi:phage N-6-adenine-methyltransferase